MVGLNVLVVDDSQVMRSMISRILRLTGLPLGEVLTAPDGKGCLDILKEHPVDLLLLDMNMPGFDGFEVLQALSKSPTLKHLPVVVVSAENNRYKVGELKAKGVKAFVGKPFSPEKLRAVILEIIGG